MLYAWSGPPAGSAPTCPAGQVGCDAPLNVSGNFQSKDGNLMVNATGAYATGFSVPFGNVGIGTASPGYKLDVTGDINFTGTLLQNGTAFSSGGADNTKVLKAGDTMTGSLTFSQGASTRNVGIVGTYDPTKIAAIWAMGAAYQIGSDGSAGSLYGLDYSYEPGYGGVGNNPGAITGLGHQMQWRSNGATQTAIGSGIWTSGNITATGNVYSNGSSVYGLYLNSGSFDTVGTGASGDPLEINYYKAGDMRMYNGDITQQSGYYIYPGSNSGLSNFQKSYYISSNASYGLYTNTSMYFAGGMYPEGYGVLGPHTSYGSLNLWTPKGGYYGVLFGPGDTSYANIMYDGSGNGGIYYENWGWATYYLVSTHHMMINTSSDLGYSLGVEGSIGSGSITANSSAGYNYGVRGNGTTYGVYGNGTTGVYGYGSTFGVYGDTTTGGYGVYANNNAASGRALWCNSGSVASGCGGNRAWTAISDVRLKKDIVTIPHALDSVLHLRGVNFNWKDGSGADTGFIAQEVLPYVPQVVSKDATTGLYEMRASSLTGLLTEAIKELKAEKDGQISDLQDKVNAQQKTIEEMQQQIRELMSK